MSNQDCNRNAVRNSDYVWHRRPGCLIVDSSGSGKGLHAKAFSVDDGLGHVCMETAAGGGDAGGKAENCSGLYHPLFARKFSAEHGLYAEALDVADSASVSWDAELRDGLFRCE